MGFRLGHARWRAEADTQGLCHVRYLRQTRNATYEKCDGTKFFSRAFPRKPCDFEKFCAQACVKRARAPGAVEAALSQVNRRVRNEAMSQKVPKCPVSVERLSRRCRPLRDLGGRVSIGSGIYKSNPSPQFHRSFTGSNSSTRAKLYPRRFKCSSSGSSSRCILSSRCEPRCSSRRKPLRP